MLRKGYLRIDSKSAALRAVLVGMPGWPDSVDLVAPRRKNSFDSSCCSTWLARALPGPPTAGAFVQVFHLHSTAVRGLWLPEVVQPLELNQEALR